MLKTGFYTENLYALSLFYIIKSYLSFKGIISSPLSTGIIWHPAHKNLLHLWHSIQLFVPVVKHLNRDYLLSSFNLYVYIYWASNYIVSSSEARKKFLWVLDSPRLTELYKYCVLDFKLENKNVKFIFASPVLSSQYIAQRGCLFKVCWINYIKITSEKINYVLLLT